MSREQLDWILAWCIGAAMGLAGAHAIWLHYHGEHTCLSHDEVARNVIEICKEIECDE